MTNSVICILGMHRSGTSCLAGCLEEKGLYLGDVVNSAPFNPKGNKENLSLRSINVDVLSFSGGSWDSPPEQLVWNDALKHRRDDHVSYHGAYDTWGFKDPRTVITLPFWLEANLNIKFVGTFRHPQAVVQSLMRRSNLQPKLPPLELWKYYNLKLLQYAAEFQFPLISFDLPVDAYYRDLGKLVQYLGLQEIQESSMQFFDNRLRSHNSIVAENELIDAESLSVYERLLEHTVNDD